MIKIPSFSFRIIDIQQGENFDVLDIEETRKINARQLLELGVEIINTADK